MILFGRWNRSTLTRFRFYAQNTKTPSIKAEGFSVFLILGDFARVSPLQLVAVTSRRTRCLDMFHERLGWFIAHDLLGFLFLTFSVEKHNGGWAKHAETLEQRLVIRVVGGHVRLQQDKGFEAGDDSGIAEGVVLHLFT